jgi:hypothetical protein
LTRTLADSPPETECKFIQPLSVNVLVM